MSTQSAYTASAIKGISLDGVRVAAPMGVSPRHRLGLDSCAFSGSAGLVRSRTNPSETPGNGSADVEVWNA
jgi:hypothetical protein